MAKYNYVVYLIFKYDIVCHVIETYLCVDSPDKLALWALGHMGG